MTETISPLLYIEKDIDIEDISMHDDYEVIKSIYPDDIKEIKNNPNEIYFLIKLKHEIEIQNSTIELLHSMKLDDLLNCTNDNCMYLPYWIKIFYSKEDKLIKISCYTFWFKYEENIKNELEKKLSGKIDEPIFYNIIEETKNIIENSLKNKKMLLDLLTEIRELKVMQLHTTTDNFLLIQTGANEDIEEDFEYDEVKLRHPADDNENNKNKKKHIKNMNDKIKNEKLNNQIKKNIDNIINDKNNKKNNINKKECCYEQFFKDGGFVGDTIIDRASTFQAHAIKITNKDDYDFYKNCLLSQKKIKKATHNITVYRYVIKDTNEIVEDYDDDGEDGAGFRVLGVIKKMKLNNLFVMVTRWFGGTLLHQDRFKRINDAAQILLNQHSDVFESEQ